MADNPVEHSRSKHIAIRCHFLRDHQQKGDIEIALLALALNRKGGQQGCTVTLTGLRARGNSSVNLATHGHCAGVFIGT
jgi:hypothetical protein